MLLEWSEHLSIDHAEIDEDHRYMIHLIDRLYNLPDNGHCLDEMEQLFGLCILASVNSLHADTAQPGLPE